MIRIRRVSGDHPALRTLHRETLPGDPHPSYTLGWWWVAFDGKTPVGFAGLHPSANWSGTGYMVRCGVVESHRGKGLQKRLIRVRVKFARGLGLGWLVSSTYLNPASSNSLIGCGFRLYKPTRPWGARGTLYWRLKLACPL